MNRENFSDYKDLAFRMLKDSEILSANICCIAECYEVEKIVNALTELSDIEVDEIELTDKDYLVTLNAGRIYIDEIFEGTVFEADELYMIDDKYYEKYLDGMDNDNCVINKFVIE